MSGVLVIISGPSGVGKTSITRAVDEAFDDAVFSVSATTRPKTEADREGVDYHFVTNERFDEMIAGGEFLEHAGVFGRRYGTPRAWVEQRLAEGKVVLLEIDVQGAAEVKRQMPDAFAMFILPPSEDDLLARLRARKREDEEQIQKRFAEAKREIAAAKSGNVYNEFLINDDLDRAIETAINAVSRARQTAGNTSSHP